LAAARWRLSGIDYPDPSKRRDVDLLAHVDLQFRQVQLRGEVRVGPPPRPLFDLSNSPLVLRRSGCPERLCDVVDPGCVLPQSIDLLVTTLAGEMNMLTHQLF